jgi:hypothetical protein
MKKALRLACAILANIVVVRFALADSEHSGGDAPCTPVPIAKMNWSAAEEQDRKRYQSGGVLHATNSAKEISARVQRPHTPEQLLKNLKVAIDADWLVQTHFFDDIVLLKFFGGSEVTRVRSHAFNSQLQIATVAFRPGEFESVKVQTRFVRSHSAAGYTPPHITHGGSVSVDVGTESGFTVGAAVDVFGLPLEAVPDSGIGGTTFKAIVKYDYSKANFPPGALASSVTSFTVRRDKVPEDVSTENAAAARKLPELLCREDVLKNITVSEMEF